MTPPLFADFTPMATVRLGGADISECKKYRYRLWREWDSSKGRACFVMLNPSTADAQADDNTIRKCITFASTWGYGAIDVVNLFAWRATDPRELVRECNACDAAREHTIHKTGYEWITGGRDSDAAILAAATRAQIVVAAWGVIPYAHRELKARPEQVAGALRRASVPLHALKITQAGYPSHPLYLRGSLEPALWAP